MKKELFYISDLFVSHGISINTGAHCITNIYTFIERIKLKANVCKTFVVPLTQKSFVFQFRCYVFYITLLFGSDSAEYKIIQKSY